MKKKYLESLQMNISNSYCQKCKHHLHLNQLNLFSSLIHLPLSSIFECSLKTGIQIFKCLFNIPL